MGFIYRGLGPINKILLVGENIVKGTRGVKVKVLSQGLHMTHVVFGFRVYL
jgi:hypothetical protein